VVEGGGGKRKAYIVESVYSGFVIYGKSHGGWGIVAGPYKQDMGPSDSTKKRTLHNAQRKPCNQHLKLHNAHTTPQAAHRTPLALEPATFEAEQGHKTPQQSNW
jgi:hypothetical protein